jgi:actin-related protein
LDDLGSEPRVELRLNSQTTPFDDLSDVLYRGDRLEACLEHVLMQLGADGDSEAPTLLLTESWCAPSASRRLLAQLCFECFQTPSACIVVDGLVARYAHSELRSASEALIVRFGAFSTHVIPILQGHADASRSLRLDVGGYHCRAHLQRSLSLQFPNHKESFQVESTLQNIVDRCARVATPSYQDGLNSLVPSSFQLPYQVPPQPTIQNLALAIQRREQNAARMRAFLAKKQEARGETPSQSGSTSAKARLSDPSELMVRFRQVESLLAAATDSNSAKVILAEFKAFLESSLSKLQLPDSAKSAPTRRNIERLRLLSAHGDEREVDQDFGLDDSDWSIYQTMSLEKADVVDEFIEQRRQLVHYLRWAELQDVARLPPAEWAALHASRSTISLQSDQISAAEVLYQPSALLGVDQMGLAEMIVTSLRHYAPETQRSLLKNIFLTGGNSSWRGMSDRLVFELQSSFEPDTPIISSSTSTPRHDAYFGLMERYLHGFCQPLSKLDYDELGLFRFSLQLAKQNDFANDPLLQ